MKTKKLILFTPSLHTGGGAERVLVDLANSLFEKGHQVSVLAVKVGNKKVYALNNQIHTAKYGFGSLLDAHPRNIILKVINKIFGGFILQNFLKKNAVAQADAIISFSATITIDCFRTRFRDRLITFEHLAFRAYAKYPKTENLMRAIYPRLKKVIVLTHAETDVYTKMGCNVFRIPNQYPFKPAVTSPLNSSIVLSIGHFNQYKRRDLLIKAWSYVHASHPDWKLHIVGDGEQKPEAEALIKTLGLQQSVQIIKPTNDVITHYLNASIFVLSSEMEALPLVILEAKIAGLPCVSFDVLPGPHEQVNDGEDGFLVNFPDTKQMGEKINELIENPELRKKYGEAARTDVMKRYSPEKVSKLWDEFLETI